MDRAKSVPSIGADCRGRGGWQHGFVTVSSKACGEHAITLAVWTQMKAVGVPHGDAALCKELAAQVSLLKAGELTRYLGKARGDDCQSVCSPSMCSLWAEEEYSRQKLLKSCVFAVRIKPSFPDRTAGT